MPEWMNSIINLVLGGGLITTLVVTFANKNKVRKEAKKLDKEADVTGGEFTKSLLGMGEQSIDRMQKDLDRAYKDRDAAIERADNWYKQLVEVKEALRNLQLAFDEMKSRFEIADSKRCDDKKCGNRIPPR